MFSPLEFIAALTAHIPNPYFQLVRTYGWYSNRMRGDRKKQHEREGLKKEAEAGQDSRIINMNISFAGLFPAFNMRFSLLGSTEQALAVYTAGFSEVTFVLRIINSFIKQER